MQPLKKSNTKQRRLEENRRAGWDRRRRTSDILGQHIFIQFLRDSLMMIAEGWIDPVTRKVNDLQKFRSDGELGDLKQAAHSTAETMQGGPALEMICELSGTGIDADAVADKLRTLTPTQAKAAYLRISEAAEAIDATDITLGWGEIIEANRHKHLPGRTAIGSWEPKQREDQK